MSYFDFSSEVARAVHEARDEPSKWSAKTTVHSARFPAAVRQAGFQFLWPGCPFVPGTHDLVIGAAPWSDPDLAALEDLAILARSRNVRINVFDVDDFNPEAMISLFPGIRRFMKTPMVLQYRHGERTYFGEGHDAVLWLRQL
jgi:hypothetical protein